MIDLQILLNLKPEQFMEMVRDIGIVPWGHRHQLRESLEVLKEKSNRKDLTTVDKPANASTDEPTLTIEEHDYNSLDDPTEETTELLVEETPTTLEARKDCELCDKSSQHHCTICGKKVCNLFCSQPDPNCSNEMMRCHLPNDPRCISSNFECPSCEMKFKSKTDLQRHISQKHDLSSSMPSMISEADDSSWQLIACNLCDGKFDNEQDVAYHKERVHEYGETCSMYLWEECGFQGTDRLLLKMHVQTEHSEPLYGTRRKQNLTEINFDDDSDEDGDWNPSKDDELCIVEDGELVSKKRKVALRSPPAKRLKNKGESSKSVPICSKCKKTFSRLDSLKRHMKSYCK